MSPATVDGGGACTNIQHADVDGGGDVDLMMMILFWGQRNMETCVRIFVAPLVALTLARLGGRGGASRE